MAKLVFENKKLKSSGIRFVVYNNDSVIGEIQSGKNELLVSEKNYKLQINNKQFSSNKLILDVKENDEIKIDITVSKIGIIYYAIAILAVITLILLRVLLKNQVLNFAMLGVVVVALVLKFFIDKRKYKISVIK